MWRLRTIIVLSVTLTLVLTLETTSIRYIKDLSSFKLAAGEKKLSNFRYVNSTESFRSLRHSGNSSLVNNILGTSLINQSKDNNLALQGKKTNNFDKAILNSHNNNHNKTSSKNSDAIRNKTPQKKLKLSTLRPITIKLTRPTPKISTSKSSNVSSTTPRSTTKKPKPTIKKIVTKWHDSATSPADLKQNWYEEGVPYPSPMPEITSSSPPFSISDSGSQIFSSSSTENIFLQQPVDEAGDAINPEIFSNSPSEPLQGVPPILPPEEDLESVSIPASGTPTANGNPISTFNLDMLPSSDLTRDPSGNPCPTVHISSAVLSAQQRQQGGCSDLNLVLNTHYHQNNQDTRNPDISTYDAASSPQADPGTLIENGGISNAGPTGVAADPGVPAGAPGGGSSGGSAGGTGGSGGSGGDGGGNDGFRLPDLKPVFDAIGHLMRGLWWILQKLMNPWLYIVPIVVFFKLGFLGILSLFPWWIPFVFLYFSVKTDEPKKTVSHVKHLHKPVVVKHPDSWYWDHQTKTWKDVAHPHRARRSNEIMIDDQIISFGDKFLNENSKKRYKRR
ncbi:hypothetical protein ABEB36_005151 [Hypothenemus hampei]|uniref:Uncharacterized protein n=1 Tax=Hypothenemus hampei TaxID=57062 RepID=A0ABD1EX64_HYPHA